MYIKIFMKQKKTLQKWSVFTSGWSEQRYIRTRVELLKNWSCFLAGRGVEREAVLLESCLREEGKCLHFSSPGRWVTSLPGSSWRRRMTPGERSFIFDQSSGVLRLAVESCKCERQSVSSGLRDDTPIINERNSHVQVITNNIVLSLLYFKTRWNARCLPSAVNNTRRVSFVRTPSRAWRAADRHHLQTLTKTETINKTKSFSRFVKLSGAHISAPNTSFTPHPQAKIHIRQRGQEYS